MPLFKQKRCRCGFDTAQAEIKPNKRGRYFCPVCGRDLVLVKSKQEETPTTETEKPE